MVNDATCHCSCRAFKQQPRALKEPKPYSLFVQQHVCLGTRNKPDRILIQSQKTYKGVWRIRKRTQLLDEFIQTALCLLILFMWSAWVNLSTSYFAYLKCPSLCPSEEHTHCSEEVQKMKDTKDPSSWWILQRWRPHWKNTSPERSYTGSWPTVTIAVSMESLQTGQLPKTVFLGPVCPNKLAQSRARGGMQWLINKSSR